MGSQRTGCLCCLDCEDSCLIECTFAQAADGMVAAMSIRKSIGCPLVPHRLTRPDQLIIATQDDTLAAVLASNGLS